MMKMLLLAILLLANPAFANCEAQIKALKTEMVVQNTSLDVRRKVNSKLQPLIVPRQDLNPVSDAECLREVSAARALLNPTGEKIATGK
ncbi:hypothetical protein HQ393_05980 [Chitinibacter bivalviorum]|uniref:Uncharacterized protein n=1 Tax=Chitinibacter bivalviorum TaxID=2739434 RepID=A0A7H9BK24_9NEIS|nr:hypothetical protein [Chitinibacter bivalviorum]QLG87844.1 hypothetical protein HQ393_05980 [Chitinibacter bivalviorum]